MQKAFLENQDLLSNYILKGSMLLTYWTVEIRPFDTAKCIACFNVSFTLQVLKKDLGGAAEDEGKKIDWLTFKDLEGSVRDDLQIIKKSPLIPDNITVYGFIYDVSFSANSKYGPLLSQASLLLTARLIALGESCKQLGTMKPVSNEGEVAQFDP